MERVKRLLGWAAGGAVLGLVIASLVGRSWLEWYNAPGAGVALIDTAVCTRDANSRLFRYQATGAAIGAVSFLVLGIVITLRRRPAPPASPTSTPLVTEKR
jgi:hypothetical protein